ncbi:MAG: Uma2 family endonuclease [Oscillatoriales cyanobacterium C42_A2020_001]|nr:Uma2 family endonuclease [Leptolyngbyaceae cyanobacterium C42_A2020_001]
MVVTPKPSTPSSIPFTIRWESLPDDFKLDDEPVENTGQPLIAGALRESLELAGYIQPEMLIAGNLGICATVNNNLVIKAPGWLYVARVEPIVTGRDRRSYTPYLEGGVPKVVMEFLSETDGGEYSSKQTFPPGKWFFYEKILQVPTYVLFDPASGDLEVHQLEEQGYKVKPSDDGDRYWLEDMRLFLGVWQGEKEGRSGYWLRWWDESGNLLLWAVEQAEQNRQQLEAERQKAEAERQRAERLAERLRSLGIDPDDIAVLL